jgi:hypothetical protein
MTGKETLPSAFLLTKTLGKIFLAVTSLAVNRYFVERL